jgi:hypothetical protein
MHVILAVTQDSLSSADDEGIFDAEADSKSQVISSFEEVPV